MANTKPARGMRDFLPSDVRKRNYVIGIIKEVYESYGFEPLETPSVENLETLTGKYGEEGNQLMFKILKRGEKLQGELNADEIKSEKDLSDLALRYDLTVPLARVVANHKNDLPKFFKRYQIQPVWRADRPARGRYREFYQCDVDAIGSSSMTVEAELCSTACEILNKLKFPNYWLLVNHRQILRGVLEVAEIPTEKRIDALTVLDKIGKVSREQFSAELSSRGIPQSGIDKFIKYSIQLFQDGMEILDKSNKENDVGSVNEFFFQKLKEILSGNSEGEIGLTSIEKILKISEGTAANERIFIYPTLARGLSYYTGAIFEAQLTGVDFKGSVGGGGRYDGLIGMFGKEQIPAVGFSIGLERILLIMEERGMFPKELADASADVMVTIWNEESIGESLKLAVELRKQGLRVLVYPEADKLGKQFKYADSVKVPFVCVLGESELAENTVTLKNLRTGEQETVIREAISNLIRAK